MESIIEQLPETDDKTLAESGFYWREGGPVKVLICKALEDAGFTNGFSTRLGGVSAFPEGDLNLAGFDEDTAENIHENRRRFLAAFDGNFRLATAWQVHGDNIRLMWNESDIEDSEVRADGLISDLSSVLVGVKTADCVPVLFGDPVTNAFAAVHAGWRGTAQSIVSKAMEKMNATHGSVPADLICAIGPAATCENYEIGAEVIDAFKHFPESRNYFNPTRDGHALIDLHLANKDQLTAAGVDPEKIFTAPFCTMERTDLFFSYRIEKKRYGKTGRLLSVIGKNRKLLTG
jgi:polyphenol oxidase